MNIEAIVECVINHEFSIDPEDQESLKYVLEHGELTEETIIRFITECEFSCKYSTVKDSTDERLTLLIDNGRLDICWGSVHALLSRGDDALTAAFLNREQTYETLGKEPDDFDSAQQVLFSELMFTEDVGLSCFRSLKDSILLDESDLEELATEKLAIIVEGNDFPMEFELLLSLKEFHEDLFSELVSRKLTEIQYLLDSGSDEEKCRLLYNAILEQTSLSDDDYLFLVTERPSLIDWEKEKIQENTSNAIVSKGVPFDRLPEHVSTSLFKVNGNRWNVRLLELLIPGLSNGNIALLLSEMGYPLNQLAVARKRPSLPFNNKYDGLIEQLASVDYLNITKKDTVENKWKLSVKDY